jgi:dimethylamine--corrinoid protein Co-methyltransferase
VGDPFAMALAHGHASGMGGMRVAGDLVARMQMTRGMKIKEAKEHVAGKLKIAVSELTDPAVMTEVRRDLQLGVITPHPLDARGIEAKFRIARVLDIDINCLQRFKTRAALI